MSHQKTNSRYGQSALDYAVTKVQQAPKGARSKVLLEQSMGMGNLLAGGELIDEEQVRANLVAIGRIVGLDERTIHHKIEDGIKIGHKNPRIAPNNLYQPERKDKVRLALRQWFTNINPADFKATEMKLAKALVERALAAGSNVFEGSYRQMSLDSNLSIYSVPRLATNLPGVSFVPGKAITGEPTVWTIAISEYDPHTASELGEQNVDSDPNDITTDQTDYVAQDLRALSSPVCYAQLDRSDTSLYSQSHEAWSSKHNAWLVFAWMNPDGTEYTTKTLSKMLGMPVRGARDALCHLKKMGLVERVSVTDWRRTNKEQMQPEEITTNRVEKRRERYAHEQQLHAVYVKVQKFLRKLAFERRRNGDQPSLKAVRSYSTWMLMDLKLGKPILNGETGEFDETGLEEYSVSHCKIIPA